MIIKKLAILGNRQRGKEIINLLEEFGGKNNNLCLGDSDDFIYYIGNNFNAIESKSIYDFNNEDFVLKDIDEINDMIVYKIGDYVKTVNGIVGEIIKYDWNSFDNIVAYVVGKDSIDNLFFPHQLKLIKEETIEKISTININSFHYSNEIDINLDNGYELFVENGKIKIIKKTELPKTYEECFDILNYVTIDEVRGYNDYLFEQLQMIIICRDAYWKIAGEQMGLGKPWEPHWKDDNQPKHTIVCFKNELSKSYATNKNCILSFPTREMRDTFYENFKELIETCKELL